MNHDMPELCELAEQQNACDPCLPGGRSSRRRLDGREAPGPDSMRGRLHTVGIFSRPQ